MWWSKTMQFTPIWTFQKHTGHKELNRVWKTHPPFRQTVIHHQNLMYLQQWIEDGEISHKPAYNQEYIIILMAEKALFPIKIRWSFSTFNIYLIQAFFTHNSANLKQISRNSWGIRIHLGTWKTFPFHGQTLSWRISLHSNACRKSIGIKPTFFNND